MSMLHKMRQWRRAVSNYEPFVKVHVSREAIKHNYNVYKKACPSAQIAPVLKSNAYGHGLIEVAHIIDDLDLPFIVVDSLFEARLLRRVGVKSSLLIIGYSLPTNVNLNNSLNTAFTVIGIEHLKEIVKTVQTPTKLHIKFDTGMHRQGLLPGDIYKAVGLIKQNKYLDVEGICTHLCDADGATNEFTLRQLEVWENVVKKWNEHFGEVKWQHVSATKGVRFAEQASGNVIRLGIGLYGASEPPIPTQPLRLALKMTTVVSSVRTLESGERVGYNITHETQRKTRVATIPVGYFEGVDRRLSNLGAMVISGQVCRILGRVSMNITSIDVTDMDCSAGDRVVVIDDNPESENSVIKMAEQANTIPYEILIHIPQHLRREVV